MKRKHIIIAACVVLVICAVSLVFVLIGNKGNVSDVNRVIGYSALYDDNLINEACNVVEKSLQKALKVVL